MTNNVLFIDDEEHLRVAFTQALELAGFNVESHDAATSALDRIDRNWPGIVVSDVKMAGMTGLELMSSALEQDPELPVILITGHGDVPMAVQAMREGAYDFIEKPFAPDVLVDAVRRATEKRRLTLEIRTLRESLSGSNLLESMIVGITPEAARLRENVTNFAETDADVLINGETGTGKELVARALHLLSARSEKPFVPVNCAALPETIIESELFGHVRGAFTGAHENRVGKFEHAHGGTLFLDEIESMPLDLQGRLLRVLEDRRVVRLGSNEEVEIDVRVVAATKAELRDAPETEFRSDLYYRLNVLAIDIAPLRQHSGDIVPLMRHFLDQAATRYRVPPKEITPETVADLTAYGWPGNVRELKNASMRYALGQPLKIGSLEGVPEMNEASAATLPDKLAAYEKTVIQECLRRNNHQQKATYEELGISRKTLYDKMKRYGLETPD